MFTKTQEIIAAVISGGLFAVFILSFWLGYYKLTWNLPFYSCAIVAGYVLGCIYMNDRKEQRIERVAELKKRLKL